MRILNYDPPANRALSESVAFLARAVERRDRLLKLAWPVFELDLEPLPFTINAGGPILQLLCSYPRIFLITTPLPADF